VRATHYLEVTQQVVLPIVFDGKRATLVSLFKTYAAIAQQVQHENRIRGKRGGSDPVHELLTIYCVGDPPWPGIERSVTLTPIALRFGAVFFVWLPPIMTKCISLSVIISKDWEKNHWSDETSPAF
jgi:hypothetical protein